MEKKHREKIEIKFPEELAGRRLIVLDIADEYEYMDEELIREIKSKVDHYL
jgi:predicted protein tyrosine phosphatase